MNKTVPSRLPVFVCYAHEDNNPKDHLSKRWLDRLLQQLSPLAIQDQVCAWSDKDIETGQDWHQDIQQTLENTKAAVLLVSPAFLASKYIRDSEVPFLLKNAKDRGVTIIPVILRHCLFQETKFKYPDPFHGPNELSLSTLQSANSPTTPLNSLEEHEQDRVLLSIAQSLLKILKPSQSPQNISGNTTQLDSPMSNVPLERNPFFTGREDILGEIREALVSTGKAAFTGLGGIGKTQTAVEYAYRHKDDYNHILWVKAESKESLTSDFAQLALLLNLPEKDAQDQQEIINAVLRWLQQNDQWLLILDNADDINLVHPFIHGLQTGHILLTTRAQATKTFPRVEVKELPKDEAARFLLLRAKLLGKETPQEQVSRELHQQALDIVVILDALTLALDQAGAYIEETQCGLNVYLELYKTHGIELLKERGLFAPGHPDPVATTWVLSFQLIEKANPAAAELLRFCAFLAPDAIPEELITQGASELGDILGPVAENPLLLNKAIGEILKYSLLNRKVQSKTLDIHRLVQAVIQNSLEEENKTQGMERMIRVLNHLFPEVEFQNWAQCDRLLPQAQHCTAIIMTHNIQIPEAPVLLNETGTYLSERARYTEAEPLYQRALAIREKTLGPMHPHVAISLNNLAGLYDSQGKYADAEPLYQRALAIGEQALGPMHPHVASSLNNLAGLYDGQGKYADAEPLYQRALAIGEQALGPMHPDVATSLNNLGLLYNHQGKYADAELLYQRALAIREETLGPMHPHVASSLNNLGLLYNNQGKYADAEPLYQRALAIREEALGPMHPDVASSLNSLAGLYDSQGKYADAELLFQRALTIWEQALGPMHPDVATSLNNLGLLYKTQGQYADAEPLYQRALAIREEALGPTHPHVASSLNNLGLLYETQGQYADAEPLYQRALAIREQALGPTHPDVATSLNSLGLLYKTQGQHADAEPLFRRALAIREETLGPMHPDVATSLNNLGLLYNSQGKYPDAEPLYQRALAIREGVLGPTNPDVAQSLNNLAASYDNQGRYAEAEPLYQRALALREQAMGPTHPDVAISLNNLGVLYDNQGRYPEAEPLYQRALAILDNALESEHPTTQTVRRNYEDLLKKMESENS